jgi:hypothetical protein
MSRMYWRTYPCFPVRMINLLNKHGEIMSNSVYQGKNMIFNNT